MIGFALRLPDGLLLVSIQLVEGDKQTLSGQLLYHVVDERQLQG